MSEMLCKWKTIFLFWGSFWKICNSFLPFVTWSIFYLCLFSIISRCVEHILFSIYIWCSRLWRARARPIKWLFAGLMARGHRSTGQECYTFQWIIKCPHPIDLWSPIYSLNSNEVFTSKSCNSIFYILWPQPPPLTHDLGKITFVQQRKGFTPLHTSGPHHWAPD